MGCVSTLPGSVLLNCRVIRQPGDGSCLFHSMAYGLSIRSNARKLRAEICSFIKNNPDFKIRYVWCSGRIGCMKVVLIEVTSWACCTYTYRISDTPLQDWVKWDTGTSVSEYSRKMSCGSWGGSTSIVPADTTVNYPWSRDVTTRNIWTVPQVASRWRVYRS